MPKTKNKIDASPELDAILGEPITDADRLAEYLKRKAAEQPKQDKELVFGDFTFDLDFDVPLIKKPPQPKQTQESRTEKPKELQPENAASASDACNPLPPPQSPKSVSISPSRRSGSKVPDSDRLRRVAIRRRSQSCGRRRLLKEFDNLMNESGKSSEFFPPISSTPCELKKQSSTVQQEPDHESQLENVPAPKTQAQLHPVVQLNGDPNDILENLGQHLEQMQATFRRTFNMDLTPGCSRPSTPQSLDNRRTFTVEKKGSRSPSMLVRSNEVVNSPTPRSTGKTSIKVPLVRLRRVNTEIEVPHTPPVPMPRRREPEPLLEPDLELFVPETQPQQVSMNASQSQKLGEIIHNLSKNTSVPLVVIPINSLSPRDDNIERNSSPNPAVETKSADLVSRSMQTSSPKMVKTSSPKMVQDVIEIMTDDDSENESCSTTAPLNLAPPGGNTTRLQRLRKRGYHKPAGNQENSIQLLNLHQTNPDKRNRKTNLLSVLNKAPSAPINGEKFAEELVRMSNYEILDLRKRNSMGLIYPLNGHRTRSVEQQQVLEENIQLEILRRNLSANEIESLPSNKKNDEAIPCNNSISMSQPAPASLMETSRRPSRSRSRRQQPPITKELANYMALEETMQQRRKSRRTSKRCLYTKGDSETEDTNSSSPEKQQRMSISCTEAVTRPPSCEDFSIVPPPPASLRFSQSLRELKLSAVQATRQQLNLNDIVLSPPHPAEFEEQSPRRTSVASSQEALSHKETATINQSDKSLEKKATKSLKPSSSKSQTIPENQRTLRERDEFDDILEALPPPADFDDHHKETSSECQTLQICSNNPNKQNDLTQTKDMENLQVTCSSASSRAKDINMEDASIERLDEEELQTTTHNHSSFLRVKSLKELNEKLPNSSKSVRTNMSTIQHESNDESSGNEKEISKRKASKGNARKLSRSKSNSKKNQSKSLTINKKVESLTNEEDVTNSDCPITVLPMDKPATGFDITTLDDQPSTSHAAREALERSTRQREQQTNATANDDAAIFKKPLAPAPRAKKSTTKLERQLARLKIITPLNGTMMDVDVQDQTDQQDTTIRRSKRGQVPLRNNWCHTIKDLTELDFVRNSIPTNKKPITKSKRTAKKKDRPKVPVSNSMPARSPLCSSTPCSVEPPEINRRSRHQILNALPSPNCSSIGVEPFSDQEDNQPELPSTSIANKQNNPQETEYEPAATSVAKSRERRPRKKVEVSTQSEPGPATPSAIPDISNSGQETNQFTSWLHGSEAMDTTNQFGTGESHASTVKDLVFKNLEGIDYAFYNTIEKTNLGYMRFKPHQKREKKRSKTNTMKFIVQYGQFSVEITLTDATQTETIVLRHGDMIEIENGTYYSITNMLDKVSVLMFIRV